MGKIIPKDVEEKINSTNPTISIIGEYKNVSSRVECKCLKCGFGSNGEWKPLPRSLFKEKACPICNGKTLPGLFVGWNDLKTWCQQNDCGYILSEWDSMKNEKKPEDYTHGSSDSVFWICPNNHPSYSSRISNRTILKRGCPRCYGRICTQGVNDLETLYPDIAKEWDYEKNSPLLPSQISAHSGNKYHWKCSRCGYEWPSSVSNRTGTRKRGCKVCSKKGTSFPEQAIYYYVQKVCPDALNRYQLFGIELDIYIPSINAAIEYDGVYYHKSNEKLFIDNSKDKLCEDNDINLIRIRNSKLPSTCSATIVNIDSEECTDELEKTLKTVFEILGIDDNLIDINADYFKIISNSAKTLEAKSIKNTNPKLASEWHPTKNEPLKIENVSSGARVYAWWKCSSCGNEWQAFVYSRSRGNGCSKCGIIRGSKKHSITSGLKNNFVSQYPELAEEIDLEKNQGIDIEKLSAGSNTSLYWICKVCGNSYPAIISNRTNGKGCKKCSNLKSAQANKVKVLNVETGEVFDSLDEAGKKYGGSNKHISRALATKGTALGYHWEYFDKSQARHLHTNGVICVETNIHYPSVAEAARKLNCSKSCIFKALKDGSKATNGFHWKYD